MRIEWIAFTEKGYRLAGSIAEGLCAEGERCAVSGCGAWMDEKHGVKLKDWTESAMRAADALVFVGACGIAVRAVAPFLRGKDLDPAVVVVDEAGRNAVALLSGHIGGANALARRIAAICGAYPVITTATDVAGRFSVDAWASAQGFALEPLPAAKAISAALLAGEEVGVCSDFPIAGKLPDGVRAAKSGRCGFYLTYYRNRTPFDATLWVTPRTVVLGIGCRRGKSADEIAAAVQSALAFWGIPEIAVCRAASIDCKQREEGLLRFCAAHAWETAFFSAEELRRTAGDFTPSAFVEETVGVDNVCERAAVAGSSGVLIARKYARDGVTVAAAARPTVIRFDGEA